MAPERSKPSARRPVHPKKAVKAAAVELKVEQRRAKVTERRLAGVPIRALAAEFKVSVGTIHSDLTVVLGRTVETADEFTRMERELSLGRIEAAIAAIWPRVLAGEDEAIDRLVRLEARRAKYLGTDAPTKQEFSGPDGNPIEVSVRSKLDGKLKDLGQRLTGGTAEPGGEASA